MHNEPKTFYNNDPFYQNAVRKGYNPYELGYFESQWTDYPDVEFVTSQHVILYTTGGFAPFHVGHKNMLELAKNTFDNQGKIVDDIIVVVDSQEYADTKSNMISYDERVESVPYTVCDFERDKGPINFTYYMVHFQQQYPDCQIVYVCGSDNANFAPLFEDFGTIAIVERDRSMTSTNPNIIFIPNNEYNDVNSSDLRKTLKFGDKMNKIFLRDDFKESYTGNYTPELHKYIINTLRQIFEDDLGEKIVIETVENQLKRIPTFDYPVISLDKYYKGDFQLDVSRHFRIGDIEQKHGYKLDCTEKNLTEELEKIKQLGFTDIVLVDDDSVSGETVNRIRELLNLNIVGTYFISPGYKDVLDVRDFIFNSKNGGLVFSDETTIFRAPYIFPYVNLQTRALFNNPEKVTEKIIELNNELEQAETLEPMYKNFIEWTKTYVR